MPAPASDAVDANEWVFIGRQTDWHEVPASEQGEAWGSIHLVVEVLDVYKGDVPATLELATGHGSADCGVDLSYADEVGLTLTPYEDGTVGVSSCGGVYSADDIRWLYEPFPDGKGSGQPGFLVGIDAGRARVALLDEQAQLLTYAEGEGRLASAAICPGGDKVVEMVQPDRAWTVGGKLQPYLEIRDVGSLAIDNHYDLDISERETSQLNGMGWVFDMQCHDVDGATVTYLLPIGVWHSWGGSNLPGDATLHIWRSGELSVVPTGEARTVAVDYDREVFYAITGADGMTLEIRDLDGRLLETQPVPLGHQAWKLALSPDLSQLAILTRDVPMDEQNWYYAEVNSLLIMDTETQEVEVFSLPAAGFAQHLGARDDGFTTATYQWEPPTTTVASVANGAVEALGSYPAEGIREATAIGSRTVLLTETEDHPDPSVVAVDLVSDELVPIADLVRARMAIAFPGSVPKAETLPTATTTTSAPTTTSSSTQAPSTEDAQPIERGESEGASGPLVATDDDGKGAIAMFAIMSAVLAILAGLVVVARARRRRS